MPRGRRNYPVEEMLVRLEEVYGRPRFIPRFDPMEELVCCILSQHSSDVKSFPAFTRLCETYPSWDKVAAADPQELARTIWDAGLGNQKAKSIIKALTETYERTGEYSLRSLRDMPVLEARKWLTELHGVGPKTASIVLCFSFGKGAIPVDTHVYRVSWRLGLISEDIGEAKAHDLLLKMVPPELAFRYHVTLIQHGRITCRAPLPLCEQCPITDLCRWFKQGGPAKRRKQLAQARKKA